ncbi:MAG TPA: DNA methyltransferase [Thermoanaerobaculia bacterium]
MAGKEQQHDNLEISCDWAGSAWQDESTFHQLAPYIGKVKSSMARSLISQFSSEGDVVFDPFAGCGTFALEAWSARRHVIANDLSPYATVLTRAKLFPYESLRAAQLDLERLAKPARLGAEAIDLRSVPQWVRKFFHPETLRETLAWSRLLARKRKWFLLACLLGILHHQRPGFLSFPSSHTVPYLRTHKFPRSSFADLYTYRAVHERLAAKVIRAFRRVPRLDFAIRRECSEQHAERLRFNRTVDAIISSPPYMRQLDYGRDNRLRLWFLGCSDWRGLDGLVSPREESFLTLMRDCFRRWRTALKAGGYCVLIVGDACSRLDERNLPDVVMDVARRVGGYDVIAQYKDLIPNERRVRRGITGSVSETVLVLRRTT